MAQSSQKGGGPLELRFGDHELLIRRRYETVSILNDLMIGIWFVVGSVLFFSPTTTTSGTWLFVAGSTQLLIRPIIRLTRHLHLGRVGAPGTAALGTSHDF